MYAETSKIEDTCCGMLGHYDAEDNRTQDRRGPSKGAGTKKAFHTTQSERQPLRPVLLLQRRCVELELQLARQ